MANDLPFLRFCWRTSAPKPLPDSTKSLPLFVQKKAVCRPRLQRRNVVEGHDVHRREFGGAGWECVGFREFSVFAHHSPRLYCVFSADFFALNFWPRGLPSLDVLGLLLERSLFCCSRRRASIFAQIFSPRIFLLFLLSTFIHASGRLLTCSRRFFPSFFFRSMIHNHAGVFPIEQMIFRTQA